jgi:hypothetical protein
MAKNEMDNRELIDKKVDELVNILRQNPPDKEQVQNIRRRIDEAVKPHSLPETIEAFRELDKEHDRLELMDDLEALLSHHPLDSESTKKYLYRERMRKLLVICIGIIMITLGMGMIIMPAPPYFEMFTLFYFNKNDGITIMDVISLLIVFTGVYLFITAIIKKPEA